MTGTGSTGRDSEIHTLHRYFIWASRMKGDCVGTVEGQGPPPSDGMELRLWASAPFCYASYWFATLYVVVEGMRQLQLSSPSLEQLLQDDDKVQRLRRFRNGIFHYQSDYFDNRIKDFLATPYVEWAASLHEEISSLFKTWFASKGVRADVLEYTDDRIRIALTKAGEDDLEVVLDADGADVDDRG